MLKYMIIQLCDSSVSYCHYLPSVDKRLISLATLEQGILWSVKQGIDIQVLYPKYCLPIKYVQLLAKHPHVKITPEGFEDSDVVALDDWNSVIESSSTITHPAVLHSKYQEFITHHKQLGEKLSKFTRLNIVFSDIYVFSDSNIPEYEKALKYISDCILESYRNGHEVQLNLLTDRIMLSAMNNCNAGVETISLAPDGRFYPCPAFYLSYLDSTGNPVDGIKIPNSQLYKLENAPICRHCDAFHCKRCVMLNKQLTSEVNTPSHQQCVMAHIERKVSKQLIEQIREYGNFALDVQIPEIDYIDPFEKIVR
ncbi:CXXX repeat peptide maturase [Bacteroides caecimuris]|uniref:CXXX repeat peptide maturase n=1 Tax=Bacteroides caecimuris TaxID=1796613 RepID=UPI00266EEF11|nr:CXXX repeat peptide maturase [Bacteroides caecimuris]